MAKWRHDLELSHPLSDVVVAIAEIQWSHKISDVGSVKVGDERFEEGHLFASVL